MIQELINSRVHRYKKTIGYGMFFLVVLFGLLAYVSRDALKRYDALLSVVTYDRSGIPIVVKENAKGHYALTGKEIPPLLKEYLLEKEDRHFYYHLGINPVSMVRALYNKITRGRSGGSSTLTEQLAKNLLHTENDRTIKNKLRELLYVCGMELFLKKETILTMYGNTVYLGNQIQGFETGSHAYFGTSMENLTPYEVSTLLATLSYPGTRNPWKEENEAYARHIFSQMQSNTEESYIPPPTERSITLNNPLAFELTSLGLSCDHTCTTSLDTTLSAFIRERLVHIIDREYERGVKNASVVVIDPKAHELLAIVGSPDPTKNSDGGKINMALEPRPIGSTVKPFIYLKGFSEGLRPYSLVDDREYRYPIATGYSLYPKNFDGTYHGEVTLHFALANSLNVPSVKVLEYIGLPDFYRFLEHDLGLVPIQPLDSYQYGIALGGLETDLLTLTHLFSLFPNRGALSPLHVVQSTTTPLTLPHARSQPQKQIAPPEYVALVNTLLSDRLTGVEQFGLTSSLNLTIPEYAVKTGTSRDFHDSWVVGYTPDFVVGVWLGNSENTPLAQVSGQSGAGVVWHDVMEYLIASPYYTGQSFDRTGVALRDVDGAQEWGLRDDNANDHRDLLLHDRLITSPHNGDVFELGPHNRIPLKARVPLRWFVNGKEIGTGTELTYTPDRAGIYEIEGHTQDDNNSREIITIRVDEEH